MDSSPSARCSLPPRLAALRCLVPKILNGQEHIAALEKLAESWLLSSPHNNNAFGEECELVVTLLYTILTLPNDTSTLLPHEFVFTFLERWVEDGGRMEFAELTHFLRPEWKCGSTKVLFLLCANLMSADWGSSVLQTDVSEWGNDWLPGITTPTWLLDAIGSSGNILGFVTLLRVSASLLQVVTLPNVELEESYLGMLTRFLHAASQYQLSEYSCSLDALQDISSVVCEERLQAWVSFLGGLCLAKIGKPHTALVKLQDAVDKSSACIAALFNIAQVFHNLGQPSAELEVLELLVKSGVEDKGSPPANLHSSLLALHHTTPEDLPSRACYYLSCRLLKAKKFVEAAEHLEKLLDMGVPSRASLGLTPRSLLRLEDTLPALPTFTTLVVLAGMAHASRACHKETIRILDNKLFGKGDIGGSTFYDGPSEDRLRVVVTAAGRVLHAEALAGLGQVTEAIKECIRVEQALWWVRGVSDSDDSNASVKEWSVIILLIKTTVYKLMAELHKTRNCHQNYQHYTRLPQQCLALLGESQETPTWQDMSPSNQLVMDSIYEYFKNRSYKEGPALR